MKMTDADIKTGKALRNEPFMKRRKEWLKELDIMINTRTKAEIQALASHGFRYLTQEYLPSKLETADWI